MVVIGAGVVGLAVAAAVARAGRSVTLLERHGGIARGVTARNSEVIHAGLYDPPGCLKATLCTEGRERLYARCARLGIPHRRLGKWIVAAEVAELPALEALAQRADANGVPGLRWIDAAALRRDETGLGGVAALESPESGIVDARALCLSLAAELEAEGGALALHSEVRGIDRRSHGYRIEVLDAAGEGGTLDCAAVVNAAGLASDRIAALAGLDVDALGYRLWPCKGDYFAIAPGTPVKLPRLVYPVPGSVGLGIHATPDLGGRLRFGPDATFVDAPRYDVDPARAEAFAAAIRRYLPAMRAAWLEPDFAGVRPRLAGPGEPPRDFVVVEESAAGLPGFVDLIGIESPGLTAALAIGERVAGWLTAP